MYSDANELSLKKEREELQDTLNTTFTLKRGEENPVIDESNQDDQTSRRSIALQLSEFP